MGKHKKEERPEGHVQLADSLPAMPTDQLTSNWKPFRPLMLGGGVRNVPYGDVVNSTSSSGPLAYTGGNC